MFSFNKWLQKESTFNYLIDLQSKLGCQVNLYQVTDENILLHPAFAAKLCSDLGDKALVWLATNHYVETESKIKELEANLDKLTRTRPVPRDSVLANFCMG